MKRSDIGKYLWRARIQTMEKYLLYWLVIIEYSKDNGRTWKFYESVTEYKNHPIYTQDQAHKLAQTLLHNLTYAEAPATVVYLTAPYHLDV